MNSASTFCDDSFAVLQVGGLTTRSITWSRFPVKVLLIDSNSSPVWHYSCFWCWSIIMHIVRIIGMRSFFHFLTPCGSSTRLTFCLVWLGDVSLDSGVTNLLETECYSLGAD